MCRSLSWRCSASLPRTRRPRRRSLEGTGEIAYYDYLRDPKQIFSIDPDGSGTTQLTGGSWHSQHPAWSADGSTIVYVRSRRIDAGRHVLVTMNADGSAKTTIFQGKDDRKRILGPAWSPDGSRIVFCAEGRRRPALFVIDAERVGPDEDHARDGISTATPRGRPTVRGSRSRRSSAEHFAIATMNTDGSGRTVLVGRGFNDDPDWSPMELRIVFFRSKGDDRSDIFSIGSEGTGRMRLTDTPGRWEFSPTFSPTDSSWRSPGARPAGSWHPETSSRSLRTAAMSASDEHRRRR